MQLESLKNSRVGVKFYKLPENYMDNLKPNWRVFTGEIYSKKELQKPSSWNSYFIPTEYLSIDEGVFLVALISNGINAKFY